MFNGYLLKVNNQVFPHKYIAVESYKITPNQPQDSDSYIDGDGVLRRTTLPHKRSKLEFNTPNCITETDNRTIQALFANRESVSLEYWNPRKGLYETGTFYAPDLDFTIQRIESNKIIYEPLRIAFIEY